MKRKPEYLQTFKMKDISVSPEILIKLGFCQVQDAEYNTIDCPAFEHPQICYVEKECRRQAILLILEPMTYTDDSPWYDITIYMQEDIGCGFLQVPHNWGGLNIDRLNDLYRFSTGEDLPGYKFMKFSNY